VSDSQKKIIAFNKAQRSKRFQEIKSKSKMFFVIIAIATICSLAIWYFYVERVAKYDVEINPSNNITFHKQSPIGIDPIELHNEFYPQKTKLSLIYFYSTWCGSCLKNFDTINEVAREFQNTKLNFLAVAIDKDLDSVKLQEYLQQFGAIYFKPFYLNSRNGFKEFLLKNNINYNGRIPFSALVDSEGQLIMSYSGSRSLNFLRKKIIENLYLK